MSEIEYLRQIREVIGDEELIWGSSNGMKKEQIWILTLFL